MHSSVGRHDNIAELCGVDMPSFETMHRNVLLDVKRDLTAYIKKVKIAANLANDDISDTVFIKYDEDGYPIIAGFTAGKNIPKRECESLLRAYLRRHYCKSIACSAPAESHH